MSVDSNVDMQADADMPDATSSESDPPTPPVTRFESRREGLLHTARHHQRSDPYSLRDHSKPRRTMSFLKPPLDIGTLSANGDIRSVDNHSPPFIFHSREEIPSKEIMPTLEPLSGLRTDVAQRLKGTVDKLRGFSLAELIPPRSEQGAQRKQVLPIICQIMQDSSSFASTESYGEGEMHAKMRLSKSCDEMCLPPLQITWKNPTLDEQSSDGALDTTPPELGELTPGKQDECLSPVAEALRAGSVDELEYPAMSPVGFFTTPASPRSPAGPAGRPRSGSQSPYRRTYSSSKGVQLKQSILGKRKAESSDDERESDKRLCLNLSMSAGSPDMDIQTGDL